jgi:heat shock protein HtpX
MNTQNFSGDTQHSAPSTRGGRDSFSASTGTLGTTKSFSTVNNLKTFALLAIMTAILLGFGSMFGRNGFMIAIFFTVVMNLGGYWFSDKIALAMSGAKEVSAQDAPQLHGMVEALCRRADLPKPRVYIIPENAPNAFATGRNPKHSAVAVTQGLLQMLSREELEGVVAHELAHIRHRDILISSVAAMMAGALTHMTFMLMWFGGDDEGGSPLGLVGMLLSVILAPIAAGLIQMAISRSREYEADRLGAEICGNPLWLASALRKLEAGAQAMPMQADPATAHMYIVNPLKGVNFASLFATHPATAERVARLETMAREMGANPFAAQSAIA